MTNAEISRCLNETADLLELQGANAFRIRAYRNAAYTVQDLPASLANVAASDERELLNFPGIGKDIAAKITQLLKTGTFPLLEELRAEFPTGLLQILRLPGVGPKRAAILYRELGVKTVDELKAAAESGRIAEIKGFGKKTEEAILAGLTQLQETETRYLISHATASAEAVIEYLKEMTPVRQIAVAGSCRRHRETCGDLDVLAVANDSTELMGALAACPLVEKVLQHGDTKQRVRLNNGMELDLRVVPEESFGAALQYFTGSQQHNVGLRRRAQDRGLKLNEYGLFRGDEPVAGATEEEVYAALDLPWIPPELRENRGEIEQAERQSLPKLITLEDIRGDLHMHTTATDGSADIREMIEGARARGLEYIAITDHSQRVSMANGLNAQRLREHWSNIRENAAEYSDIHVLCGVECDILENADLDLPDDVLAEADWVLAVLHYGLKQPREQIMKRLLNAIRNPYISAIGHPSGRLIGRRPPADIDYEELFAAAAEEGVMMEINANPARLDLSDVQAASAKALGIPIVINTDAHSVGGLDVMSYGIFQARRAGLEAADVANAAPWCEFSQRAKRSRT